MPSIPVWLNARRKIDLLRDHFHRNQVPVVREIDLSLPLLPGIPSDHLLFLLILVGAFANGSFGLMLKFIQIWKWEHIWLLFSFFAMLIFPWLLGLITGSTRSSERPHTAEIRVL